MTLEQAKQVAIRKAKERGETYFVVWEAGEFDVANEFDLETWFVGISDRDILFCTSEVN